MMRTLGNKVAARHAAVAAGVPVMPATPPLPPDLAECAWLAGAGIGYPVMLKASWGGGGRGMRVIESMPSCPSAGSGRRARGAGGLRQRRGLSREAGAPRAPCRGADPGRHARQRRAPVRARLHGAAAQPEGGRARARALPDDAQRAELCDSALRSAAAVGYTNAGTVEFLMDADTGRSTSSRSTRASRSSTPSPSRSPASTSCKAQIRISEGGHIGVIQPTPAAIPPACRRPTSAAAATRCSAASPPKTRRTASSPTTAGSPPTAARPASASGWMAARPTPAR
jgi:pyruvate carboxylase